MAKHTLQKTAAEVDDHLDKTSSGQYHQADQIEEGTQTVADILTNLDNNKEDKGSFSEDVDAKNHKVVNLVRDLENNSAAVDTASIIAILNNYVKTHNSNLNFAGVKSASDATPASKSENDAWIMYTSGSWQGVSVIIGDIVYYDGSTFKKQNRYSVDDLRKYII